MVNFVCMYISAKEDWWWWLWGDIRGNGHGDSGISSPKIGISQTGQTSTEDGSGCSQETARCVIICGIVIL